MWDLYKDFEIEFENQSEFFPAGDLAAQATPPPNAPTHDAITGESTDANADVNGRSPASPAG